MKRRRVIGTERIMLDNFIDYAREPFDEFGKGTNVIIVTLSLLYPFRLTMRGVTTPYCPFNV